jgi:uncharacterized protein (DUF2336 family)
MSIPASLAPELEEVLQHGSSARRAQTLKRLAILFAEGASRFNEDHIALFDEVLCQLSREADAGARVELSHRIATIPNAPPKVLAELASDDDIAVAQPLLKQSARLRTAGLLEIARSKGQAHLLAISKRIGLPTPLTDTLIERGNEEVLRSLAGNPSAEISDAGLAVLVEKGGRDSALGTKVALRSDLSASLLRVLVLASSGPARQRMLALAEPGRQSEVRAILAEPADEKPIPAAARDYKAAERRVFELREAKKLDEAAVVEFAENGQYEELVAALASLCAVPVSVVDRLMAGERVDPVLILCKSASWGWQTARAIMSAMSGPGDLSSRDLDTAYANFERLSPTTAQRVMRFWQVQHWERSPASE